MNDTHGVNEKGWYGFDLDGTLATYDGWKGIEHIGDPIEPMVYIIKELHRVGERVKIITARVAPRKCIWNNKLFGGTKLRFKKSFPFVSFEDEIRECEEFNFVLNGCCSFIPEPEDYRRKFAHEYIEEWCWKNLGFIPEIVYQKDHLMLNMFDDRVVQIEQNTGRILGCYPTEISWSNPELRPCCG